MTEQSTSRNAKQHSSKPQIELKASLASEALSGEVSLIVTETGLSIISPIAAMFISFVELDSFSFENYSVSLRSESGTFTFSRMGELAKVFYDTLLEAWVTAMRKAFFVSEPILTAFGDYSFSEQGLSDSGKALLEVHESCILLLSSDGNARRIPYAFVTAVNKSAYEVTFTLDNTSSYTLAKLGYDFTPFLHAVEEQMHKLREKTLHTVISLGCALTAAQSSQIAGLIPAGVAAPLSKLIAISPQFATALQEHFDTKRNSPSFETLRQLCSTDNLWVGIVKNNILFTEASANSETTTHTLPNISAEGTSDETSRGLAALEDTSTFIPEQEYIIWVVACSPNGDKCAVEFGTANTATFIYNTDASFTSFIRSLNYALEAISFKREAIRLSAEELAKPENFHYALANKRTQALAYVRERFNRRIIHRSFESWSAEIQTALEI